MLPDSSGSQIEPSMDKLPTDFAVRQVFGLRELLWAIRHRLWQKNSQSWETVFEGLRPSTSFGSLRTQAGLACATAALSVKRCFPVSCASGLLRGRLQELNQTQTLPSYRSFFQWARRSECGLTPRNRPDQWRFFEMELNK